MIYFPDEKMTFNKFVYCEVPSKREIFSRTGQRAVSPSGMYTKDESATIGRTPTESAMAFVRDAESMKEDLSE